MDRGEEIEETEGMMEEVFIPLADCRQAIELNPILDILNISIELNPILS